MDYLIANQDFNMKILYFTNLLLRMAVSVDFWSTFVSVTLWRLLRCKLFLFGLLIANCLSAADFNYTNVHYTHAAWYIPFIATSEDGKFFRDSGLAIEIITLKCDGKVIVPESWELSHRPRKDILTFQTKQFIYYVDFRILDSYSWDGDPSRDILEGKRYSIPMGAQQVEIDYRVRFPSGNVSPKYRVVSLSNEAAERAQIGKTETARDKPTESDNMQRNTNK